MYIGKCQGRLNAPEGPDRDAQVEDQPWAAVRGLRALRACIATDEGLDGEPSEGCKKEQNMAHGGAWRQKMAQKMAHGGGGAALRRGGPTAARL